MSPHAPKELIYLCREIVSRNTNERYINDNTTVIKTAIVSRKRERKRGGGSERTKAGREGRVLKKKPSLRATQQRAPKTPPPLPPSIEKEVPKRKIQN